MLVKKAMSLTMFVTMSKQLVEILQTKEGKKKEERQLTPWLQPRRPMLLMVTPMRQLVSGLKCPEMKKEEKKTQSKG